MTPRHWLAVAMLALGGFAGMPAGSAPTSSRYGSLEFTPCTLAAPGQPLTVAARCSSLRVPEDPGDAASRTIELAIAWVPAAGREAASDPVMFLAGGPGQAALEAFPMVASAFRDVLRRRHVVLVDQRGTGRSHRLACPRALEAALASGFEAPDPELARDFARRCLGEIEGAEPRLYTTSTFVADLEAVRSALGAEAVDLVGVSYGTRAALEYLRRHPSRVRALVLDSPVPPEVVLGTEEARNLEAALEAQFARCRSDEGCRQRWGDLRSRLDALVARLRQAPVRVAYADPLTHAPREDTLSASTLAGLVRLHAYSPELFAMLPMLLESATRGRYEALMAQAHMVGQRLGEQISVPLQLSVGCAEDAPWLRPDPADHGTLLGPGLAEALRAQCEAWPRGRVPGDFHAPVRVARPALLLSGEFDPATPARYGATLASQLPLSRHLVLRGQGHGVLGTGCTPRLLGAFLDRPDPQALDAGCLEALGYAPPFAGWYGWDP